MDFATFTNYVKAIFVALFPVISSEEWTGKDWTPEQRAELNKFMHSLDKLFNDKLARQYNRTIWDGHKGLRSLKVDKALEPLRKETVRTGSDKATPTADDIFAEVTGTEAAATE